MSSLFPIGDLVVSPWIDSVGNGVLYDKINSNPTLADASDWIFYQSSAAETVALVLQMTALSVVPTDATLRFRIGASATDVVMASAQLRDADNVIIARYDGPDVDLDGSSSPLNEVTLAMQPGTFDLGSASLIVTFDWPGTLAALAVHALDVVVTGERRASTAGFFFGLCGFP